MEKDVALGLIGAIVTVAGLVLVFCGFLFTKAESFATRLGDKYSNMAKLGVLPLLASFISSWVCVMAIERSPWAISHGLIVFKVALVINAMYAIISLLSL